MDATAVLMAKQRFAKCGHFRLIALLASPIIICDYQQPAFSGFAARAAGDNEIYYIDTTCWYLGVLHPAAKDCTEIAAKLTNALKTEVLGEKRRRLPGS